MKSVRLAFALHVVTADATRFRSNQSSCQASDRGAFALLQGKLAAFGVDCENMCKTLGTYPACQCPGFGDEAASVDDARSCMVKYCRDKECPNDAFVNCVEADTKVSLVQWEALLQRFSDSLSFGGNIPGDPSMKTSFLTQDSCIAQDRHHRAFIQAKLAVFGVDCENMCKRA